MAGLTSEEELTADMSLQDYGSSAVIKLMQLGVKGECETIEGILLMLDVRANRIE